MENIYPTDLIKTLFRPSNRALIATLRSKATDICKYMIGHTYIRTAFNNFTAGYLYTDPDNTVIGFCIWKEYNELLKNDKKIKRLHIVLICANYEKFKIGKVILFDIDRYCIANNITLITLQAANNELVTYYEIYGYTITDNKFLYMKKDIVLVPINIRNKKTRKQKSQIPKIEYRTINLEEADL